MQWFNSRYATPFLSIMFLLISTFGNLAAQETNNFQEIMFISNPGTGDVDWHPDSNLLAMGGPSAVIFSLEDRSFLFVDNTIASSENVSWSPDGNPLVGSGNGLWIWDPNTGTTATVLAALSDSRYRIYTNLAWSPEGGQFAVASSGYAQYDNLIWIWDVASQEVVKSIEGDNTLPIQGTAGEMGFQNISWSPTGNTLISDTWGNNAVRVWNTETGMPDSNFQQSEVGSGVLVFSPDGSKLANGIVDGGTIKIWDTSNGKLISDFSTQQSSSNRIAWSPDGSILAIVSYQDNNIVIWDLTREQLQHTLQVEPTVFLNVHWHPDGNILASAAEKDTRVWDIHTGEYEVVLDGAASNAVWSPNGAMLAVVKREGVYVFERNKMS